MSTDEKTGHRYEWGDVEIEPLDPDVIGRYRTRYRLFESDPNRIRCVNAIKALSVGSGLLLKINAESGMKPETLRNFSYQTAARFGMRVATWQVKLDDGTLAMVVERREDPKKVLEKANPF